MANEIISAPMTEEEQKQAMKERIFSLETALGRFKGELKACANELCYRCGEYRNEHLGGPCVDCRFKKSRHGDWSDLE